ncbi:Zn-ribbon domain-containing OB-fold protein [Halosolutus halophilus]|uniref:Zn-ribbon domain-containing OB-fold protein n=1 Tax=Halosolutus halophilus TaxID=1552990 RepID=UPI002235255D|nr:OB-fold domain-containing protein [Halosolutus halophilus]
MSDESVETAFDTFLNALADGKGYYLKCMNGHASLPPRYGCPDCGATDLERQPLPDVGEIVAMTTIRVPAPAFAEAAPYVLAVAKFGPVRLTGRLLNIDPDDDTVESGALVSATASSVGDESFVAFELR